MNEPAGAVKETVFNIHAFVNVFPPLSTGWVLATAPAAFRIFTSEIIHERDSLLKSTTCLPHRTGYNTSMEALIFDLCQIIVELKLQESKLQAYLTVQKNENMR